MEKSESIKEKSLLEKIQAVAIDVMNIEKDMTVGSGTYSYKAVSDKEVTLRVKKSEVDNGIISIPVKQELVRSEIVKVQKKDGESIIYVDTIKMTLRIFNIENISEFIEIESFGRGIDNGDKGFGKASTYARKYALLNAYKIATGEDPDADKNPDITPISSDTKKDEIISVCNKNAKILNNLLSHFSLTSLDDLTIEQIKTIHEQFKTKKLL